VGIDMITVHFEETIPSDPPQPWVKGQLWICKIGCQAFVRRVQGILHNIRGIHSYGYPFIEPYGDHPPQTGPKKREQIGPRARIPAARTLHQRADRRRLGTVHGITPISEAASRSRSVTGIRPIAMILDCRVGGLRHAQLKLGGFNRISVMTPVRLAA
jgi:hypothetical protein